MKEKKNNVVILNIDTLQKLSEFEARTKHLENIKNVSCANGTWNYDSYFHGMANGLILALAIIKDEDLKDKDFLDAPAVWLREIREGKSQLKDKHNPMRDENGNMVCSHCKSIMIQFEGL